MKCLLIIFFLFALLPDSTKVKTYKKNYKVNAKQIEIKFDTTKALFDSLRIRLEEWKKK